VLGSTFNAATKSSLLLMDMSASYSELSLLGEGRRTLEPLLEGFDDAMEPIMMSRRAISQN
jgi:hypothetical protein